MAVILSRALLFTSLLSVNVGAERVDGPTSDYWRDDTAHGYFYGFDSSFSKVVNCYTNSQPVSGTRVCSWNYTGDDTVLGLLEYA